MNLRNPELYQATLVDFEPYNSCFSCLGDTKAKIVKPGDLDFYVISPYGLENLIVEYKTLGSNVSLGQRLLYERMLIRGRCTVVIAWHTPGNMNEIIEYRVASTFNDNNEIIWTPVKPGSVDKLKKFITSWAETTKETHPYIYVKSEGW